MHPFSSYPLGVVYFCTISMTTIQYTLSPSPVTNIQAETGADPLRGAQAQNIEILHYYYEANRIAVGLRLGCKIGEPHDCVCGELVDARGSHSLSCKHGSGRLARHHSINDLIHRALIRANIPSIKEPKGLLRTDNKRPDGYTLIPWQTGRNLTWDVSIVNTVAASYNQTTSTSAYFGDHPTVQFHFVSWQLCCCIM